MNDYIKTVAAHQEFISCCSFTRNFFCCCVWVLKSLDLEFIDPFMVNIIQAFLKNAFYLLALQTLHRPRLIKILKNQQWTNKNRSFLRNNGCCFLRMFAFIRYSVLFKCIVTAFPHPNTNCFECVYGFLPIFVSPIYVGI